VSVEPEVDALVERAVAIANSILQGETDPYIAARSSSGSINLALMGLDEDLRVFVGLGSEWEDVPKQRGAYEREIVKAADRFRSSWGP
jgi:hypothetical protein